MAGYCGIFDDFVFRHFVSFCQPTLKGLEPLEALLAIQTIMDRAAKRGTKHGTDFSIGTSTMRTRDLFDLIESENTINLNWRAEAKSFEFFSSDFGNAVARPAYFCFMIDLDAFPTGKMISFGDIRFDIRSGRTRHEGRKQTNVYATIVNSDISNHSQIENGKRWDFRIHDGGENIKHGISGTGVLAGVTDF